MSDLPPLPDGLLAADDSLLAGGDAAQVWRVRLADGRRAVVKRGAHPAAWEAEGLQALGAAGAPVPAVIGVGGRVLVIEEVDGPADWEAVGAALADVHRHIGPAFGWAHDNAVGLAEQRNGWDDDWPSFYAERRIRPHLDAPALPAELRARLERALDGPLQQLLASDVAPSLVHGDLWSGNVVAGRFLIDPAVHHADREYDLAFAALFGGIPAQFWRSYAAAWPLPEGWERRRPALQLHHLLVHVRLFGTAYARSLADRLDQLGW